MSPKRVAFQSRPVASPLRASGKVTGQLLGLRCEAGIDITGPCGMGEQQSDVSRAGGQREGWMDGNRGDHDWPRKVPTQGGHAKNMNMDMNERTWGPETTLARGLWGSHCLSNDRRCVLQVLILKCHACGGGTTH